MSDSHTTTIIDEIKEENFQFFRRDPVIIIQEMPDGTFTLHRWSRESVFPTHEYKTAREGASRVLQLLGIGPVAPQTWPEKTILGEINVES